MGVRFLRILLFSQLLLVVLEADDRRLVVIHKQGDFDCHTFCIPGLAKTNRGTLLAVFDMRYESRRDLQDHMDIGLSRSVDGGETWSKPHPIMNMGEHGGLPQSQNGCSDQDIPVNTKTGEILVSALWSDGRPGTHQWRGIGSGPGYSLEKSSQFMMVLSKDDEKPGANLKIGPGE